MVGPIPVLLRDIITECTPLFYNSYHVIKETLTPPTWDKIQSQPIKVNFLRVEGKVEHVKSFISSSVWKQK